jgi:hypothetical protein
MPELDDPNYLTQVDWHEGIIPRIGNEPWVTVYENAYGNNDGHGFFCALIPGVLVPKVLSDASWELSKGHGLPGHSVGWENNERTIKYHRFGGDEGYEPLVISREFHGVRPDYFEILEEFRHFHNLYYDEKNKVLIKIGEDGSEEEVVRISDRKIEMRLREIRQFLAIKEMHLAVYFNVDRYSKLSNDALDQIPQQELQIEDGLTKYKFYIVTDRSYLPDDRTAHSRTLGKKLIEPFPKEKSGIWPYNEDDPEKFEEFIIGVDANSDPIFHTCNPDKLANYFGKNPEAPHYLTPVFFRRDVLAKYYSNPDRYTVSDGYLQFVGLWGLRMDNNHGKHVVVYLGDLGRDIPNSEQKYWKSFNIPPDGELSETQFKRGMLGEFADPESEDLLFKLKIAQANEAWKKRFGWNLFLPLAEQDSHFLTTLRIPTNDSLSEFDQQVLSLTKVLIDSLNEKEIKRQLMTEIEGEKGISKFERLLSENGFTNFTDHIAFLKDLQELRSKGTAHRKGSGYPKVAAKFDLGGVGPRDSFRGILRKSIDLLEYLDGSGQR